MFCIQQVLRGAALVALLSTQLSIVKQIDLQDKQAWFDYGTELLHAGDLFGAIEAFKTVDVVSSWYNVAFIMKMMGHEHPEMIDQAIGLLKTIVDQNPLYDTAQLALGFAYLDKGDFENGWEQHKKYLKRSGKNADELRNFLAEEDLLGKTVLVTYEGGLGDSLMFIRFYRNLINRGAVVKLLVQKPLKQLFSLLPNIDEILTDYSVIPYHDARVSLMSLPAVFWGQPDAIPADVPYLQADELLVQAWGERLQEYSGLKVGICWQADVFNDSSRLSIARRGIPLQKLFPLITANDAVHFFSLQKGDGVEQLQDLPSEVSLVIFDDNFDRAHGRFMDTAAVMMHMDLIITVDTAVAHLAGALGRSVWLLLPYATDWRWICGRRDSIWYPTMKIFKQPKPFDWNSVAQEVVKEFAKIRE